MSGKFLDTLFGEDEGFVYAPYQWVDGGFNKVWFKWPEDRELLIDDLADGSDTHKYLSPVLYSDKDFTFHSSKVVWADFDSGLPNLGDFPQPTYRICSSPGKEHWYWKLTHPITDKELLEKYNKKLSRAFGGDKVAWNYNRILRPPFTLNHKYSPPALVSIEQHRIGQTIDRFVLDVLPEVEDYAKGDTAWDWNQQDFWLPGLGLRPALVDYIEQDEPEHRASALISIAKSLHEYGLSRDMVMSILDYAAYNWGKWDGRADRNERLKSLYMSAIGDSASVVSTSEQSSSPGSTKGTTTLTTSKVSDILSQKYEVDWILPGVLKSKGFIVVQAAPGVGKTTLSLNLLLALATGSKFLSWPIDKKRKTLFMSLEMDGEGLQLFLKKMSREYGAHSDDIARNIDIYNGFSYRLSSPANQDALLATIDQLGPNGIVFDSLSRITDDLNDKTSIDQVFDFISKEIIEKRNMFVVVIHHESKGSTNGDQRSGMEKGYGSVFIPAWVDTVLRLRKIGGLGRPGIKITVEKGRYTEDQIPIDAYRNENLILEVEGGLTFQ